MFGLETLGGWYIQWKHHRQQTPQQEEEAVNIPEWVNSLLPDEPEPVVWLDDDGTIGTGDIVEYDASFYVAGGLIANVNPSLGVFLTCWCEESLRFETVRVPIHRIGRIRVIRRAR